MIESRSPIERIAQLRESDIGPTEENVKQKVIVPILELLGHQREDLEFEYRTSNGSKLDIYIKNVPPDCRVIIDTKNYGEDLNDHIEQIREYTFHENALLSVIANGTEIRIYSPLRGVAFERSLLYCIKRQDLPNERTWQVLSDLLHNDNLQDHSVLRKIEERERVIKDAMANEERLKQEYDSRIEGIDSDIEAREEEIDQLKNEKVGLAREADIKKAEIWDAVDLPLDLYRTTTSGLVGEGDQPPEKARRVTWQELVDAGLLRDGQTLYFYNTRTFPDEQGQTIASSKNKLKYRDDGSIDSVSELAKRLLKKHGFKRDDHGVAGPKYWRTEDGKLLNDLNEMVRARRGDRR